MSHYPADSMGFFDTIQVFFMELTGRAIMFSGRDLELLSRWRAQGVTAAVVCRGLKEAVEALGEGDPPRGIYNCRAYIEPLVAVARQKGVGGHEDEQIDAPADESEVFERALGNIERAGKASEDDKIKALYREAYRRVRLLCKGGVATPFDELAAVERALVDGFFAALDQIEQARIEERIVRENEQIVARMSPQARREHLLARRRLVLVREHGLARLVE
ncbi:MAG: hypothetical protein H0U74_12460 [Bradymonadaceae bacterium]|nr:hypothetical protein [Lujinxingiaceae bacterium]